MGGYRGPGLAWAAFAGLLVVAHLASSFSSARAQVPFFEPPEGYYGAKGTRVTAEWSLDRTQIREDESLIATLIIRGATNPHEVARPDLRSLPKFTSRFQIEDVPGPPHPPDAKEIAFAYRLRPRNRVVDGIPSMDFFFLNTAITASKSGANPYMNMRVRGPAIKVTAARPRPSPAIPLNAPDHLFEVATGPLILGEPFNPGAWAWVVLLLAGPLVAVSWFVVWRRVYPDAARLARLRRTRAVRRVNDAICRAGRTADPPAAIEVAILGYLRTRFPLPPGAETPPEVREALVSAGLPVPAADDVEAFLRRCDEARFAPTRDAATSLGPDTAALVARLEGVE